MDENEVREEGQEGTREGLDELLDEGFGPEQKEELNDMLSFFTEETPKEKEIPPEVEKKDEKNVEKEEPEEKKEEVEEKKEPEEKKEEKDPLVALKEEYEAQMAALRTQLEEAYGLKARDGKQQIFPEKKEEGKKEEGKEEEKREAPRYSLPEALKKLKEQKDLLSQDELDALIDNPALINKAMQRNREETAEALEVVLSEITNSLPLLVNSTVNREMIMNKAVTSFYEENRDLAGFGKTVQHVFEEMEVVHRDKPYEEVFKIVASESRKRLGLKEPVPSQERQSSSKGKEEKPAFAGTKNSATPMEKGGGKKIFDENARDLFEDMLQ